MVIIIILAVVLGLIFFFVNSDPGSQNSSSSGNGNSWSTSSKGSTASSNKRRQSSYGSGNHSNSQSYHYQNAGPSRNYQSPTSVSQTPQPMANRIKTLYDPDDSVVVQSSQQKTMVSEAMTLQHERSRFVPASDNREQITIDLSWSENLAELLEATAIVYTNAELNCTRKMESARFKYYTNLHFRSFTAADLCHDKRSEMLNYYDSLNKTIARLNNRNDPLFVNKQEYNRLIHLKDWMKNMLAFLESRRDGLNKQTRTLKLKIRDECGDRGRRWYDELEARVQAKR